MRRQQMKSQHSPESADKNIPVCFCFILSDKHKTPSPSLTLLQWKPFSSSLLVHPDDWAESLDVQYSNEMAEESTVCKVGVKNGKQKDTALSGGNLEDFQCLEAAHYPGNLKISGKRY